MLTAKEIRMILDVLRPKIITINMEGDKAVAKVMPGPPGYSDDKEVGRLQAKLSMMLEAAHKRGD